MCARSSARTLICAMLAALVLLACNTQPAAAQGDRVNVDLTATFPLFGAPVTSRWTPVRVTIDPGAGSVVGDLEVEYDGGGGERAVVRSAYSAAGQPATVELLVCLPEGAESIRFTASDAQRRRIAGELLLEQTASKPERFLPLLLDPSGMRVLFVTPPSSIDPGAASTLPSEAIMRRWASESLAAADRAERVADQIAGNDEQAETELTVGDKDAAVFALLTSSTVPTDVLPVAWAGYDAIDAVVLHAASLTTMQPARLAALRTWLESGGRIVLMLDRAGSAHAALLADVDGVTIDDPIRVPGPELWVSSLHTMQLDMRMPTIEMDPTTQTPWVDALSARPVRLDADARARGWSADAVTPMGPISVTGPVGLGTLTLLGYDPSELIASDDTSIQLWDATLRMTLFDAFARHAVERAEGWYGGWYTPNALLITEQQAARTALVQVVNAPDIGPAVVFGILAAAGVLMLLVGPVDFIGLRLMRRRHISWLTALGWTVLASLLAVALPRILHDRQSTLGRYEIIDLVDSGDDNTQAWSTAVLATFAGVGDAARYEATDAVTEESADGVSIPPERTGLPPGRVWRSVPRVDFFGGDDVAFAFTSFATRSAARVGPHGAIWGVEPDPFAGRGAAVQRPWTLRTTEDRGPRRSPPTVTVNADTYDDSIEFVISDVAPTAKPVGAWLYVNSVPQQLVMESSDAGTFLARPRRSLAESLSPTTTLSGAFTPPVEDPAEQSVVWPPDAGRLPGASDRLNHHFESLHADDSRTVLLLVAWTDESQIITTRDEQRTAITALRARLTLTESAHAAIRKATQ